MTLMQIMASPTGELGYGLENLEIIISTMYSLKRVGGVFRQGVRATAMGLGQTGKG